MQILIETKSNVDSPHRCHFIAAQDAAKMMVNQKDGLIVNVSSAGAIFHFFTTPYGVGKAGVSLNVVRTIFRINVISL